MGLQKPESGKLSNSPNVGNKEFQAWQIWVDSFIGNNVINFIHQVPRKLFKRLFKSILDLEYQVKYMKRLSIPNIDQSIFCQFLRNNKQKGNSKGDVKWVH